MNIHSELLPRHTCELIFGLPLSSRDRTVQNSACRSKLKLHVLQKCGECKQTKNANENRAVSFARTFRSLISRVLFRQQFEAKLVFVNNYDVAQSDLFYQQGLRA